PTQVAFLPGARRITGVSATPGDVLAPGDAVLTTAALQRNAAMTLDTRERSLVEVGRRVRVELPDGRTIVGLVTSVGATASRQNQAGGATPPPGTTAGSTVDVTIALHGRIAFPDGTPVTVHVATEVHRHVLSVPISALIATS